MTDNALIPLCRRCDGYRVVADGSIAVPCPACQPISAAGWATDRRNPKVKNGGSS